MSELITTAAELDALPDAATIAWLAFDPETDGPSVWVKSNGAWFGNGCLDSDPVEYLLDQELHPGPLTVLYRPDQQPTAQPTVEQYAGRAVAVEFSRGEPLECGDCDDCCQCCDADRPNPEGTYVTVRLDDSNARVRFGRLTVIYDRIEADHG